MTSKLLGQGPHEGRKPLSRLSSRRDARPPRSRLGAPDPLEELLAPVRAAQQEAAGVQHGRILAVRRRKGGG